MGVLRNTIPALVFGQIMTSNLNNLRYCSKSVPCHDINRKLHSSKMSFVQLQMEMKFLRVKGHNIKTGKTIIGRTQISRSRRVNSITLKRVRTIRGGLCGVKVFPKSLPLPKNSSGRFCQFQRNQRLSSPMESIEKHRTKWRSALQLQ